MISTVRFRKAFATWWACWTALHFFVLREAGFTAQASLADAFISNFLLGAAVLLVALSLGHYLPSQNRYGYLVALCAALSFLWLSVTRSLLFLLLNEGGEYKNFFSQSLVLRGATGFLVVSCAALISVLWYTLQDQKEAALRRTEADRLAKEAELTNLRQQLQPHFLFNSLNSINALVGVQPQKARTMVQQLSEFLRGTLRQDQQDWVPLEDEMRHLQLYLEIEKVRFGHRLSAVVRNEAATAAVPVMLLQPVVENAIKFGLYDTAGEVTIAIHSRLQNGYLHLRVENPFDPQTAAPQKGVGFGLRSIQRRLYLLFARNDLLETTTNGELFITSIKIPQL